MSTRAGVKVYPGKELTQEDLTQEDLTQEDLTQEDLTQEDLTQEDLSQRLKVWVDLSQKIKSLGRFIPEDLKLGYILF
jgi:uncharacterized protein YjbI with pentapeptide repeats